LAEVAKNGGRSFACLRIVLDPADTTIPEPIVNLANLPGEPTAVAFLVAVIRRPGQLPATVKFLWHTFKASKALSNAVTQLIGGGGK